MHELQKLFRLILVALLLSIAACTEFKEKGESEDAAETSADGNDADEVDDADATDGGSSDAGDTGSGNDVLEFDSNDTGSNEDADTSSGTTGDVDDEDVGSSGTTTGSEEVVEPDTKEPECDPNSNSNDCDDGTSCTVDECNSAGECTHTENLLGKCKIDDECYDNGQTEPDNKCSICDVVNPTKWSQVNCDDGDACNGGESCEPVQGCVSGTPLDCEPYLCQPNGCPSNCTSNAGCVSGYACINGVCALPLDNGLECANNGACQSNNCKNGVCCSSGECCTIDSDCSGFNSAVDQANNYSGIKKNYHIMNDDTWLAQSFTVGESGYLSKVALYLHSPQDKGVGIKVLLYTEDYPGAPDSTFVTSTTLSVGGAQYYDVVWNTPIEVFQGEAYSIIAHHPKCKAGPCFAPDVRWYNHPTPNSYPDGGAFTKTEMWQSPATQTDRLFKTYIKSKHCNPSTYSCE
jgi:hypothetical protein